MRKFLVYWQCINPFFFLILIELRKSTDEPNKRHIEETRWEQKEKSKINHLNQISINRVNGN